jgi:hypothetical protein
MCLFEFIRVEGARRLWNILKGGASYKRLRTSALEREEDVIIHTTTYTVQGPRSFWKILDSVTLAAFLYSLKSMAIVWSLDFTVCFFVLNSTERVEQIADCWYPLWQPPNEARPPGHANRSWTASDHNFAIHHHSCKRRLTLHRRNIDVAILRLTVLCLIITTSLK